MRTECVVFHTKQLQSLKHVSLLFKAVCYVIFHNLQHTIHSRTQSKDFWCFQRKNIACCWWGSKLYGWPYGSRGCLTSNSGHHTAHRANQIMTAIDAKKSRAQPPLPNKVFTIYISVGRSNSTDVSFIHSLKHRPKLNLPTCQHHWAQIRASPPISNMLYAMSRHVCERVTLTIPCKCRQNTGHKT